MVQDILDEYGAGLLVSAVGAVIMGLIAVLTYTETVEPIAAAGYELSAVYAAVVAALALVGAAAFYYDEHM